MMIASQENAWQGIDGSGRLVKYEGKDRDRGRKEYCNAINEEALEHSRVSLPPESTARSMIMAFNLIISSDL